MRFIKWGLFFLFSFVISWILIITFSQKEFKTPVPARIITYSTPSIPIYYYIAGAFMAGLLIGLCVAVYNFFRLEAKLLKKRKNIRELEEELEALQMRLGLSLENNDEHVHEQKEKRSDSDLESQYDIPGSDYNEPDDIQPE